MSDVAEFQILIVDDARDIREPLVSLCASRAAARLRRRIEDDPKKPRLIVTEWGGGCMLAADVEEA